MMKILLPVRWDFANLYDWLKKHVDLDIWNLKMFILYNFIPHWKLSVLSSLFEDDIEINHMDPPLQDNKIAKMEVDKYKAIL